MSSILELEHVSKHFELHIQNNKRIEALADVSFSLQEGEILGLTGKSGSGKSSLMKCIYRTYLVNSGRILFQRKDGSTLDLATATEHQVLQVRRTEMFYCSQFLSVIPRVSAADVVGDSLARFGWDPVEARERARGLLEKLGLPRELWDAFPSTFSGGEQQRVNIARAIIAAPRFLLVDEPTASLDAKTKDVVIDLLLGLREKGTSIVLITHDQHTLERLSSRRLHLELGRIQEVATV